MTIEAELADGRILEFPDGTSPQVVQNAVKSMMGQSQPAPQKEQNVLQAAASRPAIDPTGVLEGVGNVVSGLGSSAIGGLRGLATLATGAVSYTHLTLPTKRIV